MAILGLRKALAKFGRALGLLAQTQSELRSSRQDNFLDAPEILRGVASSSRHGQTLKSGSPEIPPHLCATHKRPAEEVGEIRDQENLEIDGTFLANLDLDAGESPGAPQVAVGGAVDRRSCISKRLNG